MTSVNASKRPDVRPDLTSDRSPLRPSARVRSGLLAATLIAVLGVGGAAASASSADAHATHQQATAASGFLPSENDGGPWPWKRPI